MLSENVDIFLKLLYWSESRFQVSNRSSQLNSILVESVVCDGELFDSRLEFRNNSFRVLQVVHSLLQLDNARTKAFILLRQELELLAELRVLIHKLLVRALLLVELRANRAQFLFELRITSVSRFELLLQLNNLLFKHLLLSKQRIHLRNLRRFLNRFLAKIIDLRQEIFVLSAERVHLILKIADSAFARRKSLQVQKEFINLHLEFLVFTDAQVQLFLESCVLLAEHSRLTQRNLILLDFKLQLVNVVVALSKQLIQSVDLFSHRCDLQLVRLQGSRLAFNFGVTQSQRVEIVVLLLNALRREFQLLGKLCDLLFQLEAFSLELIGVLHESHLFVELVQELFDSRTEFHVVSLAFNELKFVLLWDHKCLILFGNSSAEIFDFASLIVEKNSQSVDFFLRCSRLADSDLKRADFAAESVEFRVFFSDKCVQSLELLSEHSDISFVYRDSSSSVFELQVALTKLSDFAFLSCDSSV